MEEKMNRHQIDTEEALRESEDSFRESQVIAGLGSYLLDISTGLWKSSDVLDMIFGINKAYEHTVGGWEAMLHPDDSKMMTDYLTNEVIGQGKPFDKEYRIIRQNDSAGRWVHGLGKLECDKSGRPIKMLGTVQDITGRKLAEEALQKSERKYRHLFNLANDAIFIMKDDLFIDCNQKTLEMFGCTWEQIVNQPPYRFSPRVQPDGRESKEKALEKINAAYKGDPQFFEWKHQKYDGTLFDAEVSLHAVDLDSTIYLQAIVRDITERKLAEEEKKRLNRELEQILYAASHDLKTPLVNINGYSRELKNTLDDITRVVERGDMPFGIRAEILPLIKELPESFKFINMSVSRMDMLLNGLLQFSRSGKVELKKENIDMNMLISGIADNLNYKLKDAGASLKVTDLPLCTGDREQLSRVFSNLLENAVKYLAPSRKGEIKVTGYVKNNSSVYCVEDNGIGIAAEHQTQIFRIFHQLDPSKTGEGLGLAIVHRIVELHGGKVWLESEKGKWSRFYVQLPGTRH